MATKMPLELQAGDRMVVRTRRLIGLLAIVAFAWDDDMHVQLEDGSTVTIKALDVPVEVLT